MFQLDHALISSLRSQRASQAAALAKTDAAIAAAYGPAVKILSSLILSFYSYVEAQRMVRYLPGIGESISQILPADGSPTQYANAAVVAILDMDALPLLFQAMGADRPNRLADIDRAQRELDKL